MTLGGHNEWLAMYKVKAWLYLMRKKGLKKKKIKIPCPLTKQGRFVTLIPEGVQI
jgi:hypothetical protein